MDTATGVVATDVQRKERSKWQGIKSSHERLKDFLTNRRWLLYGISFLLGRAIILSTLSPFALAFLATILFSDRKRSFNVMVFLILGAFSHSVTHGLLIALSIGLFILCIRLFFRKDLKLIYLMSFVFFSLASSRLFFYSLKGQLTAYEWMIIAVEGLLGILLLLIFMQSIPLLFTYQYKRSLKNEEIICIIILFATIITGMVGWNLYGIAVEHVFSRYFVLSLAFVGGAAIGSTVGVVTGLILSLAYVTDVHQMSLLAIIGLLGGLLKDSKRIFVSASIMVGTGLVGVYGDVETLTPALIESALAASLFLLTPITLFKKVSRYVPGTTEHTQEQDQYLQKVRHVTAERVEQFSNVFSALSNSFIEADRGRTQEDVNRRTTDYFLSYVTEKTCQNCFRKTHCWQDHFQRTYSTMERIKDYLVRGEPLPHELTYQLDSFCVKSNSVLTTMDEQIEFFDLHEKLKRQLVESKQLVADQLQGVSDVMNNFADEMMKEREHHEQQEVEITEALKQLGIELEKLDIYQLDPGSVDIEMTASFFTYRGEGPKLIAPTLSHILNELIVVKDEEISPFPNGQCKFTFTSAKKFVVETGVAHAAKGGGLVSGDSYDVLEIDASKCALAISDGMGSGRRAYEESHETLRLLQQILKTGIPESVAIQSINSILSLRTTEEMFATLDLSVINLHNAHARFLKIGSSPSFIKRDDELIHVKASNLPIGIVNDFDVDIVNKQLQPGDILFMMSDGVFDGPENVVNQEQWFKRKIFELETNEPQEMADLILEEVIRSQSGDIKDDMTLLVAQINKNKPKWSTIPLYNQEASM